MKDIFKDKNKRTIFLTLIFSFILILIGTTYAYFSWQSTNNPIVNINVEDLGNVIFKGGNDINITNIGPVLDYNDGEITEFYIKKKIDNNLDININITPTILPDSLKDESFKVKLLSSTDNITYTEIKEDNFKDKETNIKFTLSTTELTNKLTYFKIIFYIDGNMLNSNNMQGQSFEARIDISVDSQCPKNTVTPVYTDTSGANAPVLAEGMIPVVYDEGLGYWIKADINAGWYNYTDKIWANAVMVKTDATEGVECSKSRSYYMNAPAYTPVKEEDILAYYVWIPRYKYKLFNATYASGTSPSLIDVTFENETSTTGNVTCTYASNGAETCQNKANGNWYTHPAFTMKNASGNKTELKGIWVGKFETTGSTTTPTVKPGVSSLRSITVANMYNTGKLFRSTDYITSNGINQSDSHMMKNIEWGAVAYLKQSNYGLGITDITINNSSSHITGRSSGDPSRIDYSSEGTYKYNEPRVIKELVEGSGTQLTVATPSSDNTYTWTNIGTSDSPIWKSANQGVASSSTTLTYAFTLNGQGVLSFDYSVSSEGASYDYLYYTIKQGDNIIDSTGTSTKIGGTSYGTADASMTYVSKTHILEVGTYTLEFTYRKDSSTDSGTDSGYVKNVKVLENAEIKTTNLGIEQGGGAASTNGNITGIYDMSGGAFEYVMGNYNETTGNSGLTVSTVPTQHIDIYSGTSVSASHLGDATGETAGWYGDSALFISSSSPWFGRGGYHSEKYYAGMFNFGSGAGGDYINPGFRVVLSTTGA